MINTELIVLSVLQIAIGIALALLLYRLYLRLRQDEKTLNEALPWITISSKVWQASRDGMLLTDAQGLILRVNDEFCRLVGKAREHLEGQLFTVCYDGSRSAELLGDYRRKLAEGKIESHLNSLDTLWDGKRIWLDSSNSIIESPGGPSLLTLVRDDTWRHEAAEEKQRLEQQLIQSREMEPIGRLARGLAHDLNNLFTVINGYSQLMLEQPTGSEPMQGQLQQIYKAGQRGAELTRRLMPDSDPSREATMAASLNVAEDANQPDGRELEMHLPGGTETILLVEDEAVVRAFAADTLKRCGYRILEAQNGLDAVKIAASFNEPIHLLLTDVLMPGIGGSELASRLRFSHPMTRVLYMSGYPDTAVLQEPDLEAGSAYLQKPFSPIGLAAKVREVLSLPAQTGRILVVDDEEGVRNLFRSVLTSAGYRVMEAADGKQAMELVKSEPFDLIITDLIMPEREGIETIRDLRVKYPALKIIAMSGAFGGQFLNIAEKMGAFSTLHKPVRPKDLLASVQAALSH